jgi:outer membrane protein
MRRGAAMFKFLCAASACMGLQVSAQTPLQDRLTGDVGVAVYNTQHIVSSDSAQNFVLPYAYFDYGRFYTRVDTFGVKTARLGMGYLELAARISFEGFKTNTPRLSGVQARANPLPVGIGTYQETPWGAFFLYGLYDTSSGGFLQEATYAAEFKLGVVTVYPQLGVEHRSRKYVQHLYGVSAAESLSSVFGAYDARASTTPVLAMAFEWPLDEAWHLNVQLRRRWLDAAITESPLVSTKLQDSGFVALTRSFK